MTGIAALMGWIPSSFGSHADDSAADRLSEEMTSPIAPKSDKVPELVAKDAVLKTRCGNCGVIESTRVIDSSGKTGGLGVVGGAVVGGVIGNQVGGGRGTDLLILVGALGGAYSAKEIEKWAKSIKRYETTVRFDDGTSRVFGEINPPLWLPGDRVKVMNGIIRLHE
jgi:outer membrane lipoprotein SlyB